MRDGTILRADVYRPVVRRRPVLLARVPYDKSNPATLTGQIDPIRAASAGYAVVVQDTRGRYASDDVFVPFEAEASDGYDTIEWADAPGEPTAFNINLGATSNVFKKGHRLRLEIATTSFPRFDPNPGTTTERKAGELPPPARQQVFHDDALPSRVILPIVPR